MNVQRKIVGNWNNKVGLCWFDWIHEHTHIYIYHVLFASDYKNIMDQGVPTCFQLWKSELKAQGSFCCQWKGMISTTLVKVKDSI